MRGFQGSQIRPAIRRMDAGKVRVGRINRSSVTRVAGRSRSFVVILADGSFLSTFATEKDFVERNTRIAGERGLRRESLSGVETAYQSHSGSSDQFYAMTFDHKAQAREVAELLIVSGFAAVVKVEKY